MKELVWEAHGYQMCFRWTNEAFAPLIDYLGLPGWRKLCSVENPDIIFEIEGVHDLVVIRKNGQIVLGNVSTDSAREWLRFASHHELAAHNPSVVFVHAATLSAGGRLLVLPGRSWTGKSTLAKALVERGLTYYSDEYAVFDDKGLVHSFPKSLAFRPAPLKEVFYPAGDLGWNADLPPAPPSFILFADYEEGAVWAPDPLSKGEGLMRLLHNTVSVRVNPERAMEYLKRGAEKATFYRSSRGDAGETADAIIEHLRS